MYRLGIILHSIEQTKILLFHEKNKFQALKYSYKQRTRFKRYLDTHGVFWHVWINDIEYVLILFSLINTFKIVRIKCVRISGLTEGSFQSLVYMTIVFKGLIFFF